MFAVGCWKKLGTVVDEDEVKRVTKSLEHFVSNTTLLNVTLRGVSELIPFDVDVAK